MPGGVRKENEAVATPMSAELLLCTDGQRRVSYSWSLPSFSFQFCGGRGILNKELQMACVFQKGRRRLKQDMVAQEASLVWGFRKGLGG